MMPLSFAALISGMMTLVATAPNLVVNSELERHGVRGFRFFSFTPFGVPILVLGIIYMLFARRWLTLDTSDGESVPPAEPADWIEEYRLADREHRVRVTDRSPLVGKTLEELHLRGTSGANVVAIERNRRFSRNPAAHREDRTAGRRHLVRRPVRAGRQDRGAATRIRTGGAAAQRRLFHRPVAGDRHGRSDRAAELRPRRQDRGRGQFSHPLRADGDRPAARQRRARPRQPAERTARRSATRCS